MRPLLAIALALPLALRAQTSAAPPPAPPAATQPGDSQAEVLSVRSTLVLVPALVKTKSGELVFTLTASDFSVTDDGVPQTLTLEQDTDSEPLALVVLVETGGSGVAHLNDYRKLGALLDAMIGNVPHRVAVVGFDSEPELLQGFTPNTNLAADALDNLDPGDRGAGIFDGLAYAVDLLRKQPPAYRRAILLLSETVDGGSKTTLDDALRAISDTNTAIYSLAFNSSRSEIAHEASKFNSAEPGPVHGCMSHAPGADPDANGNRAVQALDCASELLPPLRLARMAFIASRNSLRKNAPETVARLTGGEYFKFADAKGLRKDLFTFSNDVPNRYVLSFRPQAPHPGLHVLELKLVDRPQLVLHARTAYWADEPLPDAKP